MPDLGGRTAIVTGASRGIGRQIAIALGERGANVVVAARSVERHGRLPGTIGETADAVEAAGGRALAVATDLRDPESIEALVAATLEAFGVVDILVNNAADTAAGSTRLLDVTLDEWRRLFTVNLDAPLLLMQKVLPSMVTQGSGIIINITSASADLVPPGDAPDFPERVGYAASKAALNRLANVIAPELCESGIAVVNVHPGFVRTELVDLLAERGLVDPETAVPMSVPTRCVLDVLTAADPMVYTGQILRAPEFDTAAE